MARTPSEKEYSHERLGDVFAASLSDYDTQRRVEVLIDDFLTEEMLRGKSILDVGCGLGFFSERLSERSANVLACDVGPNLVERTRERVGCEAVIGDALCLAEQFGENRFDGVVSSECIEHTPDPARAIQQMSMVLKPNGFLSLSTPNLLWSPAVKTATLLRMRPFDGYENFTSWPSMRRILRANQIQPLREFGLHLFPFQLPLHRLSRWCDDRLQFLRFLMGNVCVLGVKRHPGDVC